MQQPAIAPPDPAAGPRRDSRLGLLDGASRPMAAVFEQLARVAPTDAPVLLTGDAGTGKELAALTVHRLSGRAAGPFLPVACGALSPPLIDSELFGHERGGFPSASRQHKGFFERADGGTLLLDEVTSLPLEIQGKVLRVMECGTLLRIGGDQPVKVDARVIAATRREPAQAIADGVLRQDLLYKLSVFPVHLPPLAERAGDVELLAERFLARLGRASGIVKRLTAEARDRLAAYAWPGNVRELENVIYRAFLLADGPEVGADHLPGAITGRPPAARALTLRLGSSIAEVERELILATLDHLGGSKREAARVLGVSLKTLYNRLNAYREEGRGGGGRAGGA
jgi:DNA-binding NtrC family response regulator